MRNVSKEDDLAMELYEPWLLYSCYFVSRSDTFFNDMCSGPCEFDSSSRHAVANADSSGTGGNRITQSQLFSQSVPSVLQECVHPQSAQENIYELLSDECYIAQSDSSCR